MEICVIGLGLLGGSAALGLKSRNPSVKIIGVDSNENNARQALELGIADETLSLEKGVKRADFTILAIPVNAIADIIHEVMDYLPEHAVLTDFGSTKALICEQADQHPKRKQFVAAHPIAGTEHSGPEAAFPRLLMNKQLILSDTRKSDPEAVKKLKELFKPLHMHISYMNAAEHDRHIAYVSHLSHISSFALGATVLDKEKDEQSIFAMAGSGFSSTVRLAKSSPEMWGPIFKQNAGNVSQALDAYIKKLQYFKEVIDRRDEEASKEIMKKANDIQRVLSAIDGK